MLKEKKYILSYRKVNNRFVIIKDNVVLYRGETKDFNDMKYLNVEEYLNKLK